MVREKNDSFKRKLYVYSIASSLCNVTTISSCVRVYSLYTCIRVICRQITYTYGFCKSLLPGRVYNVRKWERGIFYRIVSFLTNFSSHINWYSIHIIIVHDPLGAVYGSFRPLKILFDSARTCIHVHHLIFSSRPAALVSRFGVFFTRLKHTYLYTPKLNKYYRYRCCRLHRGWCMGFVRIAAVRHQSYAFASPFRIFGFLVARDHKSGAPYVVCMKNNALILIDDDFSSEKSGCALQKASTFFEPSAPRSYKYSLYAAAYNIWLSRA